jgi:hypothetical protein
MEFQFHYSLGDVLCKKKSIKKQFRSFFWTEQR